MEGRPNISEYYRNKNILVTGGSGFVGSVLLESLLRASDVGNIYILIRDGPKGQSPANRLKRMLEKELFFRQTEESLQKLVAVRGDICEPGLGLNNSDRELLLKSVNIVFHCAATINFNANLDAAIKANLLGTKILLDFCKKMTNIESFLYLSTAFCNSPEKGTVLEKIYPAAASPNTVLKILENVLETSEKNGYHETEVNANGPVVKKPAKNSNGKMSEEELKLLERDIEKVVRETGVFDPSKGSPSPTWDMVPHLGGHPNAYTFTKQLAEALLLEENLKFPIVVVRPSIVLGTLKTPFSGWIDNINSGVCGFLAGCTKGIFRTVLASGDKVSDIIPCDFVVNMCIASAYKSAVTKTPVEVYHCTSGNIFVINNDNNPSLSTGSTNPITYERYIELVVRAVKKFPSKELFWYPDARIRSNNIHSRINLILCHAIPARLVRGVEKILGRNLTEPHMVIVQGKYDRGMNRTRAFTFRNFDFKYENGTKLEEFLTPEDRETYSFDPKEIYWPRIIEQCARGVRDYFFRERCDGGDGLRRALVVHTLFYVFFFFAMKALCVYLLGTLGLEISDWLLFGLAGILTLAYHEL
ncbi:putative fatty acyl-CoA reductase CG8303 [Ctenocephalides felis]|uniref:putative fatty acyl-CoA reductase CG8303 n=1 Tax=Ctenocephalides felis TaxID=7515 RepID=UPI000E6E3F5B|nr:putative fatty acyl-CoA reductase CG8303 [Ctenocephalides felis]